MSTTSWILKRQQNIMASLNIIPVAAAGGLLYCTALDFFRAVQASAAKLAHIEHTVLAILGTTDEGPARMADMIVSGCKEVGTLDLFDSASFTLASICDAGQLIGSTRGISTRTMTLENDCEPQAPIFAIQHGDFPSKPQDDAFYIGETVNVLEELSSQNEASAEDTNMHHCTWRASNKHHMVKICSAPEGDEHKIERYAMQMFFVAALDAYAPKLVSDFAKFLASAQPEEWDEVLQGPMLKAEEDAAMGEGGTELVDMLEAQETAFRIMSVADVVFRQTGWPRGASRASFASSGGCNVDTPIATASDGSVIFYKTVIPGKMEQYRRRGMKHTARSDDNQLVCGYFHDGCTEIELYGGSGESGESGESDDAHPGPGDTVYPVYEIWHEEKDAPPTCWARLPLDGSHEFHGLVCRLRVSLEWMDSTTEEWKKIYVVNNREESYEQAIAVVCTLQRRSQGLSHDAVFQQFRGVAVVEIGWDHLEQTLTFSSLA